MRTARGANEMQEGLKDLIWDKLALGRDLNVSVIKRHDDGAMTYGLSLSLHLPANVQRRLEANATINHSGFSKRLRHYVKLGL
jgi:hypothetical protein